MKYIKITIFISFFLIFLSIFFTQDVVAYCQAFDGHEECGVAPRETCTNYQGGSSGSAVYDIVTSDPDCSDGPSFNTHKFNCDTPCGSGGGPPSGGGGSCARPTFNCGPGTTKGTVRQTMYTCAQSKPSFCPALGSAQMYETARHPTASNRLFLYGCGTCYVDENLPNEPFTHCDWYRVGLYNCVSTTPTCTVDVVPQTIAAGTSALFPASIPVSSGTITQVDFISSNPSVATVTTPDTTPSYGTTATGVGAGTTTITANVII